MIGYFCSPPRFVNLGVFCDWLELKSNLLHGRCHGWNYFKFSGVWFHLRSVNKMLSFRGTINDYL